MKTKLFSKNKVQIISDNNNKSVKIKNIISKKILKNFKHKFNITIVIGGDGFMLQTLKKHISKKKYFYGINSGNYGFLMNKFSQKLFVKNIIKSKMITISPLEMQVTNKKKN